MRNNKKLKSLMREMQDKGLIRIVTGETFGIEVYSFEFVKDFDELDYAEQQRYRPIYDLHFNGENLTLLQVLEWI